MIDKMERKYHEICDVSFVEISIIIKSILTSNVIVQ